MTVSFFFEMLWKSGLISAIALLLTLMLRSRAAADRTALLRVAICLLLALPFISVMLPAIQLELADAGRQMPPLLLPAQAPGALAGLGTAAPAPAPSIWDDPSELVLLLYIGGLLMVGGRLAAGLWALRDWTRKAEPVLNSEWTEALERARQDAGGRGRNARLLVSAEADSPLSWGWREPVILIDSDSYRLGHDADAILAHEVAHVARGDWLTLVIGRAAVALFWFNPLVWLIERAVMQDAEEAADCYALKRIEPTRYAETLLRFARLAHSAPIAANSIVAGGLSRRVDAILSGELVGVRTGSRRAMLATVAAIAIATPVAAVQLTAPLPEAPALPVLKLAAAAAPFEPVDVDVPDAPGHHKVEDVELVIAAPPHPPAPPAPPAAPAMFAAFAPPTPPTPPHALPAPRVMVAPVAPVAPVSPVAPAMAVATARVGVVKVAAEFDWDAHQQRIDEAMERASEAIERASEHAAREAERAAHHAEREAKRAQAIAARNFARGMEQGALGLERGADGMERGADGMMREAQRLRDRSYREQKIAEAAQRGKRLTHEQLVDMIEGLEEGGRDMRSGAQDMRREAQEMRRQRYEES